MREGSLLEMMFLDIATPEELKTLDERFYKNRNYGGAESYAVKLMLPVWREKVALDPQYADQ
jgi:hypothetical protein